MSNCILGCYCASKIRGAKTFLERKSILLTGGYRSCGRGWNLRIGLVITAKPMNVIEIDNVRLCQEGGEVCSGMLNSLSLLLLVARVARFSSAS